MRWRPIDFRSSEVVTVGSALETIMYAHLEHFQDKRRSVLLWFGSRDAKAVLERVNRRYDYLGKWIYDRRPESGIRHGGADAALGRRRDHLELRPLL